MRESNQLVTFVMGMAAVMVLFALLVVLGPRVIPSQLDKCWVELKKQEPKCSTRQVGGFTMMRDLRCIRAEKGIQFTATDDSGWYRVVKLPEPKPPTITGKSRTRPGVQPDPNE